MKFFALLATLVSTLALGQTLQLNREIKTELPLRSGSKAAARLTLTPGSSNLLVQVEGKTQALLVGVLSENLEAGGQILAQDFNYDGWLDLALPMSVGYGGVNRFYDLYTYSPLEKEFVLRMAPSSSGPQFCNPQLRSAEAMLTTTCKSGPAYSYADYKFDGGRPYLYRTSEMVLLNGFTADEQLVYRVQFYDAKGQPKSSLITSDTQGGKPIVLTIPQPKVFLHTAPHMRTRTSTYLIVGDKVEVLEVNPGTPQWLKVAYQSVKLGRLVRWISLDKTQ
jgi:hypothetical protein